MSDSEQVKLIASGSGPMIMPHHIMRMSVPDFDLDNLSRPLAMKRHKEPKKETINNDFKYKKKKSMVKYWTTDNDVVLDGKEMGKGALVTSKDSTFSDPDRLDWVLSDSSKKEYIGKVQGGQRSNFVIFVSSRDGFRVIPVQKWYKFTQKRTQKIMTVEEAEERMKSKGRKGLAAGKDRWTLHGTDSKPGAPSKERAPNWKTQLFEFELLMIRQDSNMELMPTKKKKTEDLEDLGMDYEDEFADDEEINLGEYTDAGEASKRIHKGGWVAGDADTDARKPLKFSKRMGMDEDNDYGPGNPYWSDEEELEEEKVELPINRALEKAKKKSKVNGEPISISNESEKRPSIESLPEQENPAKRQKVDDTNPPPPSAEQVIKQKRKEESRKARNSRGPSASPAPSTPPATGNDMENSNGLTDELFLQIIDAKSKEFTIPELILDLTSHGHDVHSPDIQRRMKQLMRKYLNHNKSTHTLTRK